MIHKNKNNILVYNQNERKFRQASLIWMYGRNFVSCIKELQASRKKDNYTMTMKFLLHKDKEEKGKPSPQKQECGCPSLQSSLRSHTHAFYQPTGDNEIIW